MSAVDDLLAFLRQCLNVEERVALAAADNDGNLVWRVTHDALGGRHTVRTASNRPVLRADVRDSEADEDGSYDPYATFNPSATTEHASRWDPARVLAEVEAKRRILDQMEPWLQVEDEYDPVETTLRAEGTQVLRHLAQPYAGWPGWRDEWAA